MWEIEPKCPSQEGSKVPPPCRLKSELQTMSSRLSSRVHARHSPRRTARAGWNRERRDFRPASIGSGRVGSGSVRARAARLGRVWVWRSVSDPTSFSASAEYDTHRPKPECHERRGIHACAAQHRAERRAMVARARLPGDADVPHAVVLGRGVVHLVAVSPAPVAVRLGANPRAPPRDAHRRPARGPALPAAAGVGRWRRG